MEIRVRLLGFFQMMLGTVYLECRLEEGATAQDLWRHLEGRFEQLRDPEMRSVAGIRVNGTHYPARQWESVPLHSGSEVDLLTRMGGG